MPKCTETGGNRGSADAKNVVHTTNKPRYNELGKGQFCLRKMIIQPLNQIAKNRRLVFFVEHLMPPIFV
jgi:hypothetical protein